MSPRSWLPAWTFGALIGVIASGVYSIFAVVTDDEASRLALYYTVPLMLVCGALLAVSLVRARSPKGR